MLNGHQNPSKIRSWEAFFNLLAAADFYSKSALFE